MTASAVAAPVMRAEPAGQMAPPQQHSVWMAGSTPGPARLGVEAGCGSYLLPETAKFQPPLYQISRTVLGETVSASMCAGLETRTTAGLETGATKCGATGFAQI